MKKMKLLTVIYFVLAAILAVITVSFAAYTSLGSAKRVVTVKGTEQFFTSDVLQEYQKDTDIQTRVISFGEEEKVFSVTVCNYLQGDVTKYDTKKHTIYVLRQSYWMRMVRLLQKAVCIQNYL